jgi:Icc-related predicted phosphoesterase
MLKRLRARLNSPADTEDVIRLYYASDVHGSETCWRKFLNAGAFYKADVLIMGGDIIGKAIAPIETTPDGPAQAMLHGKTVQLDSERAIADFEQTVRAEGIYPARLKSGELQELNQDPEAQSHLFENVVRAEIRRWLVIAEEKVVPGVQIMVMCGNDDPWFVDDELRCSTAITFCDDDLVTIADHEVLSLSYSNRTPWSSPRELDEPDLLQRIRTLASRLHDPSQSIFNLHVPPFDTGLDTAPRLDDTLRPVTNMGEVETIPVGSTAVRQAIEEFQPLLSLHGHIHESRGLCELGHTVAINPGSEYSTGRIHGALIDLNSTVRRYQLVSG